MALGRLNSLRAFPVPVCLDNFPVSSRAACPCSHPVQVSFLSMFGFVPFPQLGSGIPDSPKLGVTPSITCSLQTAPGGARSLQEFGNVKLKVLSRSHSWGRELLILIQVIGIHPELTWTCWEKERSLKITPSPVP